MRILPGGLNRTCLAIFGIVLLVAGGFWLFVAAGYMTHVNPLLYPNSTPLNSVETGIDKQLLPGLALLLGVIPFALGLSWLSFQIPRRRQAPTLQFHRDAREGVTLMDPSVISNAVAQEVQMLENVTSARAVLRGSRASPSLILRITVYERSVIQNVLLEVSKVVLPRVVHALETPLVDVGIEIAVTRQSRRSGSVRVH